MWPTCCRWGGRVGCTRWDQCTEEFYVRYTSRTCWTNTRPQKNTSTWIDPYGLRLNQTHFIRLDDPVGWVHLDGLDGVLDGLTIQYRSTWTHPIGHPDSTFWIKLSLMIHKTILSRRRLRLVLPGRYWVQNRTQIEKKIYFLSDCLV